MVDASALHDTEMFLRHRHRLSRLAGHGARSHLVMVGTMLPYQCPCRVKFTHTMSSVLNAIYHWNDLWLRRPREAIYIYIYIYTGYGVDHEITVTRRGVYEVMARRNGQATVMKIKSFCTRDSVWTVRVRVSVHYLCSALLA